MGGGVDGSTTRRVGLEGMVMTRGAEVDVLLLLQEFSFRNSIRHEAGKVKEGEVELEGGYEGEG